MQEFFLSFVDQYPYLAPFLFILLRAVPIVIAPIPGLAVDFVGLALFPWYQAFALALLGAHLGAAIAFYIGRVFRESAVRYFAPLRRVHSWEDEYSEQQKFWTLVVVRLFTSPFFDYVSYAAGLTKMSFGKYILSTFIGITPYVFAIYYFGGLAFFQGPLYALVFFVTFAVLAGLFGKKIMKKFNGEEGSAE